MNKRIVAIIILLVFVSVLSGCTFKNNDVKNTFDDIEINPNADAAKTESVSATMYYADASLNFLVGESRTIDAPVNDRLEVFILQELINGPDSSNENFNSLINPRTEIVSITNSEDVLSIVLSNDFLSWPFETENGNADTLKMLAVYSIVNTLIEASGYPRVQILVDRDSSGAGQRLQIQELGSSGYFKSGEAGVLGPLSRNDSIVLVPETVIDEIMNALTVKDFYSIYNHIAYNDTYGHKRPDESVFINYAQSAPTVEGYSIGKVIVSDNGQSAVVMIDYTLRFTSGETLNRTGVPTYVLKENGIWKQTYSNFQRLFEMAEDNG